MPHSLSYVLPHMQVLSHMSVECAIFGQGRDVPWPSVVGACQCTAGQM